MARSTSFPWISTGLEMLPPTLMVVLGYPWLGAACLGAVLACSVQHSRMLVRFEQERHKATLSYAQDATSMGGDPTTVITRCSGTRAMPWTTTGGRRNCRRADMSRRHTTAAGCRPEIGCTARHEGDSARHRFSRAGLHQGRRHTSAPQRVVLYVGAR